MKTLRSILLLVCIVNGSWLFGQQNLTLEQCREMALENNKQIIESQELSKKAGYDVNVYRTNYLPKLSAVGNYLFTSSEMNTTLLPGVDLALEMNNFYMAGVQLQQPIYTGGKITSAYRISKIGKELADLNQLKTRTEVILAADEAYWMYVQTIELAKTAHAYKEFMNQLLRDVENAYQAGMKPKNDLLKVQVKLNEVQLQVMQADNGVVLSRMNLCHIIGIPLQTQIEALDTLDESKMDSSYLPDITARPEYRMMCKKINLKEEEIKLIRSDFLPAIGVTGSYGYANGLKLNNEKLFDGSSFSAIVSVNVPLFQWGEGQNKVRSAKAQQVIATIQRDDLTEKMELELLQALNAWDESKMEILLTQQSLALAEENREESRNRYLAGMGNLTELLESQTMWQQANAEFIRAQTDSRLAETRYLKASGKLEEELAPNL